MNRTQHSKRAQSIQLIVATAALFAVALTSFPPPAAGQAAVQSLERPGGERIQGKLTGNVVQGFSFVPADGAAPLALDGESVVHFDGHGLDSRVAAPLFRVLVGETLRLSGSLRSINRADVHLGVSWQGGEVLIPRPAVQVILQRAGVARVLVDNFEALEPSRWSKNGNVSLVDDPHLSVSKSLRIPYGGASVTHKLDESLSGGRLELAYQDDGSIATGQRWSIDLTFRFPTGPSVVSIFPGWADESLAVESLSGPTLTIQRLARTPGWHRLVVRFTPENMEISVDGKDLAHGKGPEGPLTSIRLASLPPAAEAPALPASKAPACHVDDLQITRFTEVPASFELDISQDDARLVTGDQLFGEILSADSERVSMIAAGERVSLPWGQVAGIHFRRAAAAGAMVEGLLARVEWRSGIGDGAANLDFAEGAITAITDRALTMSTPYSGTLSIPTELLERVLVRTIGRRYTIDATSHHLGDEISKGSPVLDPPEPEGGVLERSIELLEVADGAWFLVVDVLEVVGEHNDDNYSPRVRNGELLTHAVLNGRRFDNVNRHIRTENKTPERVAMAIPAGLLHPGKNIIRLELTGLAEKETQLDDLGVLELALELRMPAHVKGRGAESRRPGP
jgi:hypothetical protein